MTRDEAQAAAEAGVPRTILAAWVAAGWVRPTEGEAGCVFDEVDVARARLVLRLRDDLDLDEDALPLVLSLIDQVHGLRRRLRMVTEALDALPPDLRARVARHVGTPGG